MSCQLISSAEVNIQCICFLTFLLPAAAGLGTDGVFIAEPVSNLIGGMACFVTMLLTVLPELKRMAEK